MWQRPETAYHATGLSPYQSSSCPNTDVKIEKKEKKDRDADK